MVQPGQLLIGSSFFLKLETEVIKLDVGSASDALSYLVASYYVFNCHYPESLKVVYGFLERLFSLPIDKRTVKRNSTITDFITKIEAFVANDETITQIGENSVELWKILK